MSKRKYSVEVHIGGYVFSQTGTTTPEMARKIYNDTLARFAYMKGMDVEVRLWLLPNMLLDKNEIYRSHLV